MALCAACRTRLSSRLRGQFLSKQATRLSRRPLSNSSSASQEACPASATSSSHPASAQPLPNPHFASFPPTASAETLLSRKKQKTLVGSIPGGQELRGLGYTKAKPTILAMEDDQYPEWLWRLLDSKDGEGSGGDKVDLSAMTKKQRHKYDRKQEKLAKLLPREIPVHEQSKDLTGPDDSAVTSLERRQEITKSSREARRKGIRENNFLRGM